MPEQPADGVEEPLVPGSVVIYESTTHEDDIAYLKALRDGLQAKGLDIKLLEVKHSKEKTTVGKVLEETQQVLKHEKVILAFPDDKFCEGQLVATFNAIMKRHQQSFVAVIIYLDELKKLPRELKEFQFRWVKVDRTQEMETIINDLRPFLQNEPKTIDFAFMNSGTGLAWSYYFGYLVHVLPDFEEQILSATRGNDHQEIPENRLSKKLFIVFTTNCREPVIMKSDRIIFKLKINKGPIDRAGLKRDYDLSIREVKSKDGKESYYGVVYFLSVVKGLSGMRDDPQKEFVNFTENDMRTQGKHCFEKLKLFMKYTYNETIKIDQSKIDFIEFNTEAANANENDLADDIFNRMKATCFPLEASREVPETSTTDANQTGVIYDFITGDIKEYVDNLTDKKQISECPTLENRIEFGSKLIRESKRIFMVLTDEFVKSDVFAKWFYEILDKGYKIRNRRFLVCLDCLSEHAEHPKVLELHLLFTSVSYKDANWADKVTRELNGDVKDIAYDLQFNNIGAGLAMSWYYRYLTIRVPKQRDVIEKCPALKTKFENNRMSHKVFILHPHSCHCPGNVSDACPDIKVVDNKEINLPQIKKGELDYTPQVYCLKDREGKEYYAFIEFNAQADTMYRMMKEGFLTNEEILQTEWNRFCNKLYTLINHPKEPMDIRHRTIIIPYHDDKNFRAQDGDLEQTLLNHIQYEIAREQRVLPKHIENGATVDWENTAGVAEEQEGENCCNRTRHRLRKLATQCCSCCGLRNEPGEDAIEVA